METPSRGFTLIELMVAVAIVAILAAVAYPSYTSYIEKSRRADAMAALMAIQHAQEKLRANCPFYAQTISSANTCGANAGASVVNASSTSPDGYYTIAIVAGSASATGYTATATPAGAQANDDCGTFAVNGNGPLHTGSYANASCWSR